MSPIIIVGAGIVGLSTAYELTKRGQQVLVIEKEAAESQHQTGRNSGVIHSGLYYKPGSLKATLGGKGAESMLSFAREHGVASDACGKLVVATSEAQLPALQELHDRGIENGVPCRMVSKSEALEYEPELNCVQALRVESTAIVDYRAICATLVRLIRAAGSEVLFGNKVEAITTSAHAVLVATSHGEYQGSYLINCAGLHSDRLARLAGQKPEVRIIPFRGEYFELTHSSQHLVKGLIYPVPDPRFPFLGVHLTKMVAGGVHAGPNAVFALAREGYTWKDVNVRDLWDSATWPGLWKLAATFTGIAAEEVHRSLSRKRFAESLQELVPAITAEDLIPAPAGVRAQAMKKDGTLVDDFFYQPGPRQVHLLNVPSPAATAALEIGRMIVDQVVPAL